MIFSHDMSRVFQCLLISGNAEIRDELFDELTPEIIRMSKSLYARFFVVKMLKHGFVFLPIIFLKNSLISEASNKRK
jgi:pumilio family protein 6